MLLPRRKLLALAGFDEQHFKTLQRRDQVPTLRNMPWATNEAADEKAARIDAYGYFPLEGVMLAVADELHRLSFDRAAAKDIAERGWDCILEAVERVERGETAWLLISRTQGGFPEIEVGADPADLAGQAKSHFREFGDDAGSYLMLSCTPTIRRALEVAKEFGLTSLLGEPTGAADE